MFYCFLSVISVCSCLFGWVELSSLASSTVGELIVLAACRIIELVFLDHNFSNDSHVGDGLGLSVLDWLPMLVPEELIRSEHRVSLVSDHTEERHAARDPICSVQATIDRLG
jgi:hypothetical protein